MEPSPAILVAVLPAVRLGARALPGCRASVEEDEKNRASRPTIEKWWLQARIFLLSQSALMMHWCNGGHRRFGLRRDGFLPTLAEVGKA